MDWLFNFFKKLWNAIKKVLAVILIILAIVLLVMAVFATGGMLAPIFGVVLTTTQALLLGVLAITGAFLIDPETASEVTGEIADAVGSGAAAVTGIVGAGVAGVAEGVLDTLASSPVFWIALAVGALVLLKGNDDSYDEISAEGSRVADEPAREPRVADKPAKEPRVADGGSSYGTIAI